MIPLAEQLRPRSLTQFFGQSHLLGPEQPLRRAIESGAVHSMVLWGPPGVGKTTLARMLSQHAQAEFVQLSAVLSGVKDIRSAVEAARQRRAEGRDTVVFVDEVHRFNKSQQDAFLPHIEDGTIIFVGATTENPAFELNNALLSRVRVYTLKPLDEAAIRALIEAASAVLSESHQLNLAPAAMSELCRVADGDARRVLNILELASALADGGEITTSSIERAIEGAGIRRFDKGQDYFYDLISALHKSVRGSNPDAALYWYARLLDGGCDPAYVARRALRIASEDIGNADPRALGIALDAWDAWRKLGSPEGELAVAQALVYLAAAPKSNAVYTAFNAATRMIKSRGTDEVPNHLRNAPTKLAKAAGHGAQYRYDHDEPDAFAAGQTYFPDALGEPVFYDPPARGLEIRIGEKLARLRQLSVPDK